MKTILAAALLLCCFGTAAHADYGYRKMAGSDEAREQCDALAMRLHNAVTLYFREPFHTTKAAKLRAEAAQLATIYQAICIIEG